MAIDDRKEDTGWPFWAAPALLPIPHGGSREAKPAGELSLTQAESPAHLANVYLRDLHRRHPDRHRLTSRPGNRLLKAFDDLCPHRAFRRWRLPCAALVATPSTTHYVPVPAYML
jgi:hypothetical protein